MLRFLSTKWQRSAGRWLIVTVVMLVAALITVGSALAVGGNVGAHSIQIDGIANLFASDTSGGILNNGSPPADIDWVDSTTITNTGTNCLQNSIASCNQAGVTAAVNGKGTWNGVRIVDGFANNDQDIFLTGGKEDDTSTWNVGPGSVGSSKYDATQGYIANNQQNIYFGMERRGNNGTTAFDFEFNQVGTAGGYIPTRTANDVLFTFEMSSSGSGSVARHVFFWNGTQYCEYGVAAAGTCAFRALPAGLVSSINDSTTRPAGPWGTVDSGGNWVLGNLDRFTFAEAAAPLSVLNLSGCGGNAYVQLRTRSSSTANSDLKDATKIFAYTFGGPTSAATLTPTCSLDINYSATAATGGTAPYTYSWQFQQNVNGTWTNVGTATGQSGTFTAPAAGTYRALLTVTDSLNCSNTPAFQSNSATVYTPLSASPALSTQCDLTVTYAANASGGSGSLTYAWTFLNSSNQSVGTSTTANGSFTAPAEGAYHASLVVTDSVTGCSITVASNTLNVFAALTASTSKSADASTLSVTMTASSNGTNGQNGVAFQWQKSTDGGTTFTNISGATANTYTYSSFETDLTPTLTDFVVGTDHYYGKLYQLQFRLHVDRNGTCGVDSAPVTVKKVIAVDP